MNFEKIRVNARVKLIGKVKTGNFLIAFSAILRIAVYTLAVLVILHYGNFYKSKDGRVLLVLCGVALFSGVLLLCCARTVKDRWFTAMSDGCNVSVTDLITRFTFSDVLGSVGCGLLSSFLSLLRLIAFLGVPSAVALGILLLMNDGVSKSVFYVLVFGFVAVAVCSAFFLVVSLGCVSLARSLSFCDVKRFIYVLRILDKSNLSIFGFSVFLSNFNRCVRRFSKLEYARLVYTFL